jgi:hypothetical protein
MKLEMNKNIIKIFEKHVQEAQNARILLGGTCDEEDILFKVTLYKEQALIAFPKFTTIGIGFVVEEDDWNTNLPYTCDAEAIYNHIKINKKYKEITKQNCIQAIQLLQQACKLLQMVCDSEQ